MKKIALFLAAAIIFAASGCRKDFDSIKPSTTTSNGNNNVSGLTLNFQVGGKKSVNEVITSGATVTGDIAYKFRVWLEPSSGSTIAKGTYTITYNSTGVAVYNSTGLENGIDFTAPYVGTYTLTCSGTYNGNAFSYTGVSIIVTSSTIVTTPATAPVKIKGMTITSGTANVSCSINKTELDAIAGTSYFYVERINGNNFTCNALTGSQVIGDSVFFTFSFPVTSLSDVDFNAGKYNSTSNPIWLSASIPASNPSILFAGNSVGNYFRVRLTVSGNIATLSAPNGQVLFIVNAGTNAIIPGNNGDDATHGYTLRWSGLIQYCDFLSNATIPIFRYKVGSTGTFIESAATLTSGTTTYYQSALPTGTIGTIYMQFGNYVGSTFVPLTNLSNSMYWDATSGCLVVTI